MKDFKDGTIEYYRQVKLHLGDRAKILDYGSGRGSWYYEDENTERREIRTLKKRGNIVVGADIDDVVLTNPTNDENYIINDDWIEKNRESFDLISADYVLEHIKDHEKFFFNINILLKKGGYFLARTPHKYSYVAIGSRMIPRWLHSYTLKRAQPQRKNIDVFRAYYKINTLSDAELLFEGYKDYSYLFTPEPAYFADSKIIRPFLDFIHRYFPKEFSAQLFIIKQKY
tara:strand:+ start:2385 stop:3068 length:684 start_codon:yes stop_codon:yes gene_type:complete